MDLLHLFFQLEYSDFAPLPAADANAKFSQNDHYILRLRNLMEHFYLQQEKLFFGTRNLLYYYPPDVHQGHVVARLGESIILEFLSAYEINTARFLDVGY